MILLKATTETLEITTSSVADIDYSISYADITATTFLPSTSEGKITTATTTTALTAPAASTQRQIKLISITNRHASTTNTILVKKDISGIEYYLTPVATLLAGETMQYVDGQGWIFYASNGSIKGTTLNAAGVDKSIQFNDGGTALGADADLVFDKSNSRLGIGLASANGSIALGANTTDQTVPASGLVIYAKDVAGKLIPKWVGPAGLDNPIQPGLGFNGIKQVAPATGTTATTCMTAFATAFTNSSSGTISIAQIAVASTSIKTMMRSVTIGTPATASAVSSHFTPQYEVCGAGGYLFVTRFYTAGTIQSGQREFHGLANRTTIFATVDPTTDITVAKVGMGYALSGTTGSWKIVASSATSAYTAIDLGSTNFSVNVNDVYELVLFSKVNDISIGYRVTNLTSSAVASGTITIGTNTPANTLPLAVHHWVSPGTVTAGVATFGLNKWYLESDY